MIFIKIHYLRKIFSFLCFSREYLLTTDAPVEHIHKQNSHLYEILHFTGFAADLASGWDVTLDIYSFLLFHLIQILHMNVYGPELFTTVIQMCLFFLLHQARSVKCQTFKKFMTKRTVQVSSAIFLHLLQKLKLAWC